jgi:hypothetical protein
LASAHKLVSKLRIRAFFHKFFTDFMQMAQSTGDQKEQLGFHDQRLMAASR